MVRRPVQRTPPHCTALYSAVGDLPAQGLLCYGYGYTAAAPRLHTPPSALPVPPVRGTCQATTALDDDSVKKMRARRYTLGAVG